MCEPGFGAGAALEGRGSFPRAEHPQEGCLTLRSEQGTHNIVGAGIERSAGLAHRGGLDVDEMGYAFVSRLQTWR